jgi:purine-binding chemotaxis protein CheW
MLFGLEQRMADADTRTIVINVGSRIMGCTVDSVSQVIRLQADQIRPAPEAVVSDKQRFVEGFARSGDDLFIVLDANCLLDPAGLASVSKSGVPSISDTDAPNAGDLT